MAETTRWERHEQALHDLRVELYKGPFSARQLAERLNCSKPTIYARLGALEGLGIKLKTETVRDGARGPKATGYLLLPDHR